MRDRDTFTILSFLLILGREPEVVKGRLGPTRVSLVGGNQVYYENMFNPFPGGRPFYGRPLVFRTTCNIA